jgi:protein SCO1/2
MGWCHKSHIDEDMKPVVPKAGHALGSGSGSGVDEKSGQFIPLDTVFTDETGRSLKLGDIIDRPVVFQPAYFNCPKSCSLDLANLAIALDGAPMVPGKDYRVISMSFDETETPDIAQKAKKNYMALFHRDFPEKDWVFLTGGGESIRRVLDAVGYRVSVEADGNFIHPNALVLIARDGKIIRYIYGTSFLGSDIAMGISEAAKGTPSVSVKQILSFCFNFDPKSNRIVFNYLRIGAIVIGVGCGVFMVLFLRKKGPAKKRGANADSGVSGEDVKRE